MAIFVTLFCANESELSEMFPGWLVPSSKPRKREGVNPFTGEAMTFTRSWLPAAAGGAGAAVDPMPRARKGARAIPPVLPPDGESADYQRWMEKGAPAALRALPHATMKGIFGSHLDALAEALRVEPTGRPARVAPDGSQIDCLPDAAVTKLATLDERKLTKLAKDWARLDATGEDPGNLLWVLRRVHVLARLAASSERRLCVFVAPL